MGRHFECTDEIIVVSKGKEDIGKVPALGNDGKLDPSVIPELGNGITAIAGLAIPDASIVIKENYLNLIPMKKVIFDQGDFFTGDGKTYIKLDGVYIVTAEVCYNYTSNKSGTAWVAVRRNGEASNLVSGSTCPNQNSVSIAATTSLITRLKKGDYLEVIGNTSGITGAAADILPEECHLSIARLGD